MSENPSDDTRSNDEQAKAVRDAERKKVISAVVRQLREDESFKRDLRDSISDKVTHDRVFKRDVAWGVLKFWIVAAILTNLALVGVVWTYVQWATSKHFESADVQLSNTTATALIHMTNRVVSEFEAAPIKATVENVAKGEAKSILEGEVRPLVASFRDDALFIKIVARAQALDFKAYQRLLDIQDATNENAALAGQIISEIDRTLERNRRDLFARRTTYASGSAGSLYTGPFSHDELALAADGIVQDRTPENREGLVNSISDSGEPRFLPVLMHVLTNETDTGVADKIVAGISTLSKQEFRVRDYPRILNWWSLHRAEHPDWPIKELRSATAEISAGRYVAAETNINVVLQSDPKADMARAIAILCCIETGQPDKATSLFNGFKESNARWAEWSAALVALHSGDSSNATIRFAEIARKQPSLPMLPNEGSHAWRKIDWTLYKKTIETKNP